MSLRHDKRGIMKYFGVLIILCILFVSCSGRQPENLGIYKNQLADCPKKPNCVSSQARDETHWLPVFRYPGEKETAFKRLKETVTSMDGMTLITENDIYLHFECRSAVFGFVDDLEFYFSKKNVIQVRSASRLGYSDFGVNRKRVEKLRELFAAE
jgi:uncharacterized protein (DUF1499 family)